MQVAKLFLLSIILQSYLFSQQNNFKHISTQYESAVEAFSILIRFESLKEGFITLKIYDILGREVKTLINEFRKSDRYEIRFDASNLASGVYFYQLRVNDFVETKKMMLVR